MIKNGWLNELAFLLNLLFCILLPISCVSQMSSPVPGSFALSNFVLWLKWDTTSKLCSCHGVGFSCPSPMNQEAPSDWLLPLSTQDVWSQLFGQGCLRPPARLGGIWEEDTAPGSRFESSLLSLIKQEVSNKYWGIYPLPDPPKKHYDQWKWPQPNSGIAV